MLWILQCSIDTDIQVSFDFFLVVQWNNYKIVTNPYKNCHKSIQKLSQIHAKIVTNPYKNCHKSIQKLSQIHAKIVTNPYKNCHKSIQKLSQIHTKKVTNPFKNCHKSIQMTLAVSKLINVFKVMFIHVICVFLLFMVNTWSYTQAFI